MWATGLVSAIAIKLSSSIDDVVWLAPFLTTNSSRAARVRNAIVYISVCLVQTIAAMVIAYSGDTAISYLTRDAPGAWSTDKILTVTAGSLLALYSLKLGHEYITELREGSDDDDDSKDSAEREINEKKAPTSKATCNEDEFEQVKPLRMSSRDLEMADVKQTHAVHAEKDEKSEVARAQALFCIAFLGSVDDLTLFVPMLVGKGFDLVQLVVGAFIAASSIVLLCIFVGLCKPVADFLSNIPLVLIVIAFAVMLLAKGFMMD